MSDKVTETFTSEDDVRYALIRVLLSDLASGKECRCRLPARCVMCLAMLSLGFEAWPDNDRARDALRSLLVAVRPGSGLWRHQMSELVDHMHAHLQHSEDWSKAIPVDWVLAIGELDMSDTEQRETPEPADVLTGDGRPA